MKKIFLYTFIIIAPLFLTGCVGDLQSLICDFLPDSDHCFQSAAIQEGQIEECEKVSGANFKDTGSNPPRDKCYLLIAENTGNLEACKQIKGGLMSYTKEECFLSVAVSSENPEGCKLLSGANLNKCRTQLGEKMTPDRVIDVDKQIEEIKNYLKDGTDPDLEKQLKGLEDKRTGMMDLMTKANKAEYEKLSDPISQEIIGDFAVGDIDSLTKNKLLDFNKKLKDSGVKMSAEQYESIRDYLAYVNNPDNNIENMSDSGMTKDRWNEKVGNAVDKLKFWKTNPSEAEKGWDEQLRFYERMLERQAAIAKGMTELQEDFNRNMGMVYDAAGNKIVDVAKDAFIEKFFGEITGKTVGWTTMVLGEAIDTVKAEAKSMEFRGLARAYDLGMAEEVGKFGGDVERAHAEVVRKMMANAYEYEDGNPYAKYGNVLENKDCDGSNPHCVNKEVFWKAMKKSYKYQHQGSSS
ncbi:MAG TPA: hypothetical protein DEB09_05975 [Candidatus Magasanikbacteria bacterium]|nr:hypothetical protein [Candidatus Magasanikbacteria bacterium]